MQLCGNHESLASQHKTQRRFVSESLASQHNAQRGFVGCWQFSLARGWQHRYPNDALAALTGEGLAALTGEALAALTGDGLATKIP
jgi:hypothetical protein